MKDKNRHQNKNIKKMTTAVEEDGTKIVKFEVSQLAETQEHQTTILLLSIGIEVSRESAHISIKKMHILLMILMQLLNIKRYRI